MKRIYLIGAALVLFLAIGADYLYTNYRTPASQNTASGQAAMPTNTTDGTAVNTPAPPVATPAVTNTYVTTRTSRKNRYHHTKGPSFVDYTIAPAGTNQTARYVNDDDGVAAETSNDYFAITPAKPAVQTKKVVRIRPANIEAYGHRRSFSRNFGIGLEVGFNQNGLTNSPASNIQTGSVNAGIITNFRLGDNFAIQPALLYINKGTKSMSESDVNTNEKFTMHYLQMPVDMVYKFGNPDDARVMIGAGPYISYLLSARDKFNNGADGASDVIGASQPSYNTGSVPTLDWGLDAFVGCESPEGLFAKAGGQLGFRNIQQDPLTGAAYRNYSFMVSVGYILSGNRK